MNATIFTASASSLRTPALLLPQSTFADKYIFVQNPWNINHLEEQRPCLALWWSTARQILGSLQVGHLHNVQCTIHNAQCTMNNVQYTIHSAQYRCYCYTSKKITARCVRELNKYTINIQLEQYLFSSPQTIRWNSSSLSLSFQARSWCAAMYGNP